MIAWTPMCMHSLSIEFWLIVSDYFVQGTLCIVGVNVFVDTLIAKYFVFK